MAFRLHAPVRRAPAPDAQGGPFRSSLRQRLLVFFVVLLVVLVAGFVALSALFGVTGRDRYAVHSHFETELSIISDEVAEDFGRLALGGLSLAEDIVRSCERYFAEQGVAAVDFAAYPELIEPLLAEQIQLLAGMAAARYCGGAFMMLDATVAPDAPDADSAKAGLFIKKTQPTATDTVGVSLHYLRGPAQIARDNGIMLLGQWQMEFDVLGQEFFDRTMQVARDNPDLPLSRLYYWSGRVTLKGNSEAGFLLCVPLRTSNGSVFGLCGIEVSDRMFKSLYTPAGGDYAQLFTAMAPSDGTGLLMSRGLVAGNYYLTGNRWEANALYDGSEDGFLRYVAGDETYGGLACSVRLYPNGSPYEEEAWSVAVLMPQEPLGGVLAGDTGRLWWVAAGVLAVGLVVSVVLSRRYLRPVNEAFLSIRTASYEEQPATPYFEINDLFEFLAQRDRAHEEELGRLHEERAAVQMRFDQAQTYLTHLADERMPEVDEDGFEMFLSCLHTLTPRERQIFDLYLEGKKAKDIRDIAGINQNTLKYHNKNIYAKLGVTSRKQLLEYAALMKYRRSENRS